MTVFFIILGIVLLVVATAFLLWNPPPTYEDTYGNERNTPKAFVNLNKLKVPFIFIGFGLLFFSQTLMYARPGHQYYVVNPLGSKSVITEAGWKVIFPMSRVQEWEKYIDVKVISEKEPTEGIDGIINGAIPVRFIDQVTAGLKISVRMQIPTDDASFIRLAEEFRHPQNLVNNTLIPTVKEQSYNVAYMYRAEEYVSGSASDFRATLDDALKNGGFVVERVQYADTIYEDISPVVDVKSRTRGVKDIQTRYEIVRKLDNAGNPLRNAHDITKNNIIVTQVIVDDLLLEGKFKDKLEQQRDISAQKSIETQKIETARIAQQRILAEGERDKASERVEQEKQQVAKLIAIETQVKEEESKRQLAAIALETERLLATKRKVAADAKKYEIVQADEISAERKYIIDKQTEQIHDISEALKATKWPTTYYNASAGGSKGSQDPLGNLTNLMTMQLANQMKATKSGN